MSDNPESELKSESLLQALDTSIDGIGIVNAEGNLIFMNTALMKLHGISENDKGNYIAQPWMSLYNEQGRLQLENIVLPQFEADGYWRGLSPIERKNGEVIMADLSLTRLKDGGIIGTARDVTEMYNADEEKREMETQLFQAQKMEAIGRLAGGIAHDFNNILAAMNGYAEFLVEDLDESSAQYNFANNILQAGRQARSLVDQILTFSRQSPQDQKIIDLRAPIDECILMLNATLPKSIELNSNLDLGTAPILGNTTQISQIMMNLCVNASDAMRDGRGQIQINLREIAVNDELPSAFLSDGSPDPEDTPLINIQDGEPGQTLLQLGRVARDQRYAVLSVVDNGSGMSRVIVEHIFEPFFTTKDEHKGTGLGLATVHGAVTSHRGAMLINSTIGEGTRFDLFFPLSDPSGLFLEEDLDSDITPTGGNVLLVEDQPEVMRITQMMLERLGYTVDMAINGLEALDMIRDNPAKYDVILTDQNMPKMSGIELVNQTHMDLPDMPFIILSGYSLEKLQNLINEHEAIKSVLRKPVSQKELGAKIAKVICKTKSRAASAEY